MDVGVTEEHQELAAVISRFVGAKSSVHGSDSGDGPDRAIWSVLATQLDLPGMSIPTEFGGAGYGPQEQAVVAQELGRGLFVSPYFATVVLAAAALMESQDERAQKRWLPQICAGTLTATLAVGEGNASWRHDIPHTRATQIGAGWFLNGQKTFVLDGATADLMLVVAAVDGRQGLFAVEDPAGLTRTTVDTLDPSRPMATVELTDVAATRIGDDAGAFNRVVYDRALVTLAAEQVGGARRCLEMATDYAKLRVAFGRRIGSFQAIKHKCADMLVGTELAESTAAYAASITDAGPELSIAAAVAKSACSDAFLDVARANVQVHGGIGFTWEHGAHRYFKRAKASQLLFGAPVQQRARLGELLGWSA
jgi:alkylation response protein AidB-like acyl-CoA dehydrogenase